METHTIMVGL